MFHKKYVKKKERRQEQMLSKKGQHLGICIHGTVIQYLKKKLLNPTDRFNPIKHKTFV